MEDPRKHEKKNKKNKIMPVAINIGAGAGGGSFGIGGIVLFGGALVTATLVSALAIKTRRQRRSSSDTIKKSRSPSPEPQSVGAPNQLELMMKINKDRESSKDLSIDSSQLDLQNPSDGITNTKEVKTKPVQNLIPDDEKVDAGDGNEDVISSVVVGEDEENTRIYVDSLFERKELNNGYEKMMVEECEEQVVLAAQTEEESHTAISVMGAPKDDGGEEQKYSMQIDDENDEQTDASIEKPLVSNEALMSMGVCEEDHAAVEEEESIRSKEARDIIVDEDNETVLMNEKHQIEVEDNPQVENSEQDLINERGFVGQIVGKQVMREEEEEEACVHEIEVEEKEKDCDDEIVLENSSNETGCADQNVKEDDQQMQCNEQVVGEEEACVEMVHNEEDVQETHSSTAAVDDQRAVREDNPPRQLINEEETETAWEVQVETITENVQLIDDAVTQDNPKEEEEDDELVKKEEDEISHVQSIQEEEEDATMEAEEGSDGTGDSSNGLAIWPDEEEQTNISSHKMIQQDMEEDENHQIMSQDKASKNGERKTSESWKLKLRTWSLLVSMWCFCHWYSALPLPEFSLVGSLLFILVLLAFRNRTRHLLKYE